MKRSLRFFYDSVIIGVPGTPGQDKHRVTFHKEFSTDPHALRLRKIYRIFLFLFGTAPFLLFMACCVVSTLARLTKFASPNLLVPDWILWLLIFNPVLHLLPKCEIFFIRSVVERQKRLVALSRPRAAERLLWFFLPTKTAEETIDHINFQFEKKRQRFGAAYARRWYWWQVVLLIPLLLEQLNEKMWAMLRL